MLVLAALVLTLVIGLSSSVFAEATAQTAGQRFQDCSNCPEMVVIPAGDFLMGSSQADTDFALQAMTWWDRHLYSDHLPAEQPQHAVRIARPFALSKYAVTRAEFETFVRAAGYFPSQGCSLSSRGSKMSAQADWRDPGFTQTPHDPVVCVSWQDARAYINWLNSEIDGRSTGAGGLYRLPSEAELEYAMRARTRTAYWWGDSVGSNNANCDGCGSRWDKWQTAPVGSFDPNPFGLFDASGNASQWTEDCWNDSYVSAPDDGSARTTGDCDRRVIRGGSYAHRPWALRSAARARGGEDFASSSAGFRVARALP